MGDDFKKILLVEKFSASSFIIQLGHTVRDLSDLAGPENLYSDF